MLQAVAQLMVYHFRYTPCPKLQPGHENFYVKRVERKGKRTDSENKKLAEFNEEPDGCAHRDDPSKSERKLN
ncbi:unnamed protein product [Gongylonema pulchrum]|uniref:Ovule protein n=1 Tax=Gongylonema pulchrum TaxID=637853 RepID=A0A183CZA2_9BILA|nr:unnamed protein product [Gongylonema pulchrum]